MKRSRNNIVVESYDRSLSHFQVTRSIRTKDLSKHVFICFFYTAGNTNEIARSSKKKKEGWNLSGSVRARYLSFIVYLKAKIAISLMQSESRFSSKADNENCISKNSERYQP